MALTVSVTPFGPPALESLRAALSDAKSGDALAPATVLVPNNFVGITTRRALAGGRTGFVVANQPGLAAVDFVTIYRLAELLGASVLAASGRRPVSTPVVAAAVRGALRDRPGVFAGVAQHPTTERRLVSAHRELSELTDSQLHILAGQSQRAHDVVAIHRAVTAQLGPRWYGEQDLVLAAASALESDQSSRHLAVIGATVLFLPELLSPSRAMLMQTLAGRTDVTVIAGCTAKPDADAAARVSLGRLQSTVSLPTTIDAGLSGNRQLVSVSDADDEVRHVVRGVVEAAANGVAFDRMAVFYPNKAPYARLLHDHLPAAGIPVNGAAITSLGESVAGRLLSRLLNLPDRQFRREEVMALVAGAPLRWDGRSVPSRAWDQVSRLAGVVKGATGWDAQLSTFIDEQTSYLVQLQRDPDNEWRTRRVQGYIEHATSLRAFMTDLVGQLSRGQSHKRWSHLATWCKQLLGRYIGQHRDWPEAQRQAKDRIVASLDRLGTLDTVEPEVSMAIFRRSLDLDLDSGLGRSGSFGNGVLIGETWMAAGLDLDYVWILGLSEGTFPSRHRDDSLLPDRERRSVDALPLRSDSVGDQHRHLIAALAAVGPSGTATLVRPRGDLRQSDERAPCRWLYEALGLPSQSEPGDAIDHLDVPWATHVPSFASGVLSSSFPPTEQEYALKSLVHYVRSHGGVNGHPLVQPGGAVFAAHRLQEARGSDQFTRFDGNLGRGAVTSPTESQVPTSATALESWSRCPQRYFMQQLLRIAPLDNPEQRQRIDPLSKGTLIHAILEQFVAERIAASNSDGPRRGWTPEDQQRLQRIATEQFATAQAKGLTGEALYWRRDQVLMRRDLEAFLTKDHDRRHDQQLLPVATELGFGLGHAEPVPIQLPSGRTFLLRGSIDLVDRADDGHLVVVDYKTGKFQKMSATDPHKGGTKLQLVLYADAARTVLTNRAGTSHLVDPTTPVSSYYWHIHAGSNYRLEGYHVTDEVRHQTLQAVETIIDNIAAGVFTQHPEESTRTQWVSCPFCDPDGLGTGEARRRFLRKANAPLLADYLVLAEPSLAPPARLETS